MKWLFLPAIGIALLALAACAQEVEEELEATPTPTAMTSPSPAPTATASPTPAPAASPASTPTAAPTIPPEPGSAASQLAYVGGDGAIWLVDADGSGRIKLGGRCSAPRWLGWAPTGSAVACRRFDPQAMTSSVLVVNTAGKVVREIDDVWGSIYGFWPPNVAWSPDGQRIAYRARDGSLKIADVITGAETVVRANAEPLAWPSAERLIVGLNLRETGLLPRYEAHWLNLETGETEPISRLDDSVEFWLAPDGRKAIVLAGPYSGEAGGVPLAIYDLETGQERGVSGGAISYPSESIPLGQLAISADSTKLYWANPFFESIGLYRANMDGSGLTRLGTVPAIFVTVSGDGLVAYPSSIGDPPKIVVEDLRLGTTVEVGEWFGGIAWRPTPSASGTK